VKLSKTARDSFRGDISARKVMTTLNATCQPVTTLAKLNKKKSTARKKLA